MIIALYIIVVAALSIYSYSLLDPNLTFFSTHSWEVFRDAMVQFGYYHRDWSWTVYVVLVVCLFAFHYYFVNTKHKKVPAIKLAIVIGCITAVSYPFLTHDFFNYLFDAKILTFYHQNPYLQAAGDFPGDPWLRFLHWTHRTYPYGPTFLIFTLIPSFISMGKFIVSYFLMKLLFVGSYIIAVWILSKMKERWALILATHPLIIIEGLVNGHNDILALTIGIVGLYYTLHKHSRVIGIILSLVSGGIKYTTLPLVLASKSVKQNYLVTAGIVILIGYLSFYSEIQPWYFMTLFVLLPFHELWLEKINIFLAGLLFSYYPYIRLGGWDTREKVELKHTIIMVFVIVNVIWYLVQRFLLQGDGLSEKKNSS